MVYYVVQKNSHHNMAAIFKMYVLRILRNNNRIYNMYHSI